MKKTLIFLASLLCMQGGLADSEPVSLFDGETLQGWKALNERNAKYWSVKDGIIEASNGDERLPENIYLASEKEYGDFEFSCKFRLNGDPKNGFINGGIQYRSPIIKHPNEDLMLSVGYQADIGDKYWGNIYDENRRALLCRGDRETLYSKGFDHYGWHTYKIVCKGNRHQLYIDDVLVSDFLELNKSIPAKGPFALQLHCGGTAKFQICNIFIKEL